MRVIRQSHYITWDISKIKICGITDRVQKNLDIKLMNRKKRQKKKQKNHTHRILSKSLSNSLSIQCQHLVFLNDISKFTEYFWTST